MRVAGATLGCIALGTVLAIASASCGGASTKQIATAKQAVYKTEFELVWEVARDELFKKYEQGEVQPNRGFMQSEWTPFDAMGRPKPKYTGHISGNDVFLLKMSVRVARDDTSGGWGVEVNARVAERSQRLRLRTRGAVPLRLRSAQELQRKSWGTKSVSGNVELAGSSLSVTRDQL